MDQRERATARRAEPRHGRVAPSVSGLPVLLLVAVAVAVAWFGPGTTRAGAHSVGGVEATDDRTRITAGAEPFPGVAVRPVDGGDQLELTVTRGTDVVVVGYDGEPYLRVGPRGAFENRNSPATYLNRTRLGGTPVPDRADPEAAPSWRRISDGDSVRWHDHRAHWMGTSPPPAVRRDPDRTHLIQRFSVPVVRDGRTVRVRGDVMWIPGPSPWPWIAGAVVVAGVVVVGARTRRAAPVLAAAIGTGVAAAVLHAAGSWTTGDVSFGGRVGAALPTAGVALLGIAALVRLRRGPRAAAPLLVFAGLFLAIAVGLADLSALSHSQVPTVLPVALDRLTVALALGLGAGVTAGAALHVADRPAPGAGGTGRLAGAGGAE